MTIHGTEYRVGSIVQTGFTVEELPEFSSIEKIIVTGPKRKITFYLSKFVTVKISFHYHAFDIRKEIHT